MCNATIELEDKGPAGGWAGQGKDDEGEVVGVQYP